MSRKEIRQLSNRALLSRARRLAETERVTTLNILEHLIEIERRKLHLSLGFGSLFDYCTHELGYSSSAAGRRIQSARCIRRFPEVGRLLAARAVNLSTVSLIATVLNDENKAVILREVRGKSQRDVEMIVARYRPPLRMRDRVRPVRVAVPVRAVVQGAPQNPPVPPAACEKPNDSRSGSDVRRAATAITKIEVQRRLLIQFLADPEFMRIYDEARALLSNRMPRASFEDVFKAALEEFVERHSPSKRNDRREKRRSGKEALTGDRGGEGRSEGRSRGAGEEDAEGGPHGDDEATAVTPGSTIWMRRITARARDAVHERDGGRCTYVGRAGKRCGSRHRLQLDHIKPFALGGANDAANLRLLCAKHNRLAAEVTYGSKKMQRYTRPLRE